MTRFLDSLAATLAGILVGVLLMASIVPDAWMTLEPPTSRPSPQAELGSGRPSMTTEGVSRPAAAGLAARTGRPDRGTRPPTLPLAIGTRPAPTATPRTSMTLRGTATWYDYRRGHAAAGPELRRALGAGWRGSTVRVAHGGRSVVVILSDWCGCPGGRVVDLDVRSFAVLADPSVGVIPVTVTPARIPAPPETSTEDVP